MIKGWFREVRTRKELTLIRKALERIADCMEEGSGSPTGLRSHYKGSGMEGTDLVYTDDEALARLEAIDRAAQATGSEPIPGFDEGKQAQ
ncbi:MAG: hypothetical protein ACYTDW_09135 [Planctomycetota bacterium]